MKEAKARRDKALSAAVDLALEAGTPVNVYHKEGSYRWGVAGEFFAVIKDGWMLVCSVHPSTVWTSRQWTGVDFNGE